MTDEATRVHDARSFRQALAAGTRRLEIAAAITDLEPVALPAGTQLHGTVEQAGLAFTAGGAGLRLTADHEISALRLTTDPDQIALGLTDTAPDLGTLALSRLNLEGRLHLEAERARHAVLTLRDIHVATADARSAMQLPAGFGVKVLAGGLTGGGRANRHRTP